MSTQNPARHIFPPDVEDYLLRLQSEAPPEVRAAIDIVILHAKQSVRGSLERVICIGDLREDERLCIPKRTRESKFKHRGQTATGTSNGELFGVTFEQAVISKLRCIMQAAGIQELTRAQMIVLGVLIERYPADETVANIVRRTGYSLCSVKSAVSTLRGAVSAADISITGKMDTAFALRGKIPRSRHGS